MGILSWIGGIIVFFWVLGLIFSIGGLMIHWLLVIAAIAFIVDMISRRRRA
ncbi:lmo0937 family membrane protein [Clostridium estertheticum]|uniref:lmo0937 family membrane protein n=1 Tax=Clostridium estertheticum TaxID=238834 RepID=UPI0013E93165|nr:lmo0937 family membrane protein [Clostridium estertheticum]MBZ9688998.1 lmo0937 family membrane protein [Clostridium estertheticum]